MSTNREKEKGPLRGRETEFEQLSEWISKAVKSKRPTSIYISGLPGTGKTATIVRVIESLKQKVYSSFVSCATTSTLTGLYKELLNAIGSDLKPSLPSVRTAIESSKKPLVLILDEMDHLKSRKNASLYAAFNWPEQLSHKVIIIGIANAIDLTERVLTKLKLSSTPPCQLVFEPYTKEAISHILKDKLQQQEEKMDEKAVELCARKVAAMSGDLRQALHIVSQTATQHKSIRKRTARQLEAALAGPSSSTAGASNENEGNAENSENAPPQKVATSSATPTRLLFGSAANVQVTSTPQSSLIGCRQVLSALNSAYSTPLARARLPLQPRLLLAICLTISANKKKSLTRNAVFAGYKRACECVSVPPLSSDELACALETLQSQSFVSLLKDGRLMLQVDSETARKVVCDTAMLDQIASLNL